MTVIYWLLFRGTYCVHKQHTLQLLITTVWTEQVKTVKPNSFYLWVHKSCGH